ncbi:hypothetical protein C482_15558 [Natrialba chahannaoensis JCM 10990]|uniref:Uncharacterized protein n=1 Tax=Natrialba chahannaoensis JCM 10990 TaxID=1227492 RepID=M0ADU0_9EURY|nr:hypothetical protein [Natrialba chahannaoensis]ELY96556.1 hypothetical protein C482_15558 [Natrialba chahannaoensis JCM 10990]
MHLSVRWLYARSAWNRSWLWDIGSLLALVNGGVLTQVGAGRAPDYTLLVLFVGGFGATFLAFLAVDLLVPHWLPVVTFTGTYQILISSAVVGPFFVSAAVGASLLQPGTALDELVLVVLGNAATLTSTVLVVAYYSWDGA